MYWSEHCMAHLMVTTDGAKKSAASRRIAHARDR